MGLVWGEVDGVATLRLDHGAFPGPLTAGLVFGVGRADETMLVSGITHVVEHLVLQPLTNRPYGWNGQVQPMTTKLVVKGTPEQIVSHFSAVTTNFRDLPLKRLADEARVLRIEEERTGKSQIGLDLTTRYGARGPGLIGWSEHGLNRLEPEEVARWVRTYFTPRNAVLWLTGDVPADLDLSALPSGPAPTRVFAPPASLPARTWLNVKTRTVSLSTLSEQLLGVLPMFGLAARRAFNQLRVRDALSYAIEFVHIRLPDGRALEYLQADGSDDSHRKVREGLVRIIEELASEGPTDEDVDSLREYPLPEDHQSVAEYLDQTAERHVLGLPTVDPEGRRDELAALTSEHLVEDLRATLPTLVGIGPEALGDEPEGWTALDSWSPKRVAGREYQPIEGRERGSLVTGIDGVTWVDPEDRFVTVHWDEAVAGFTWDNGSRAVVGTQGQSVLVVPWNWRGGQDLTDIVDRAIEPARRIRMGQGKLIYERDPGNPQSAADVRWLGTVVGARYHSAAVDLVIDTDGFFLLFSRPRGESVDGLLHHLRHSDRTTLLGTDPRNRFVPHDDIELVELTKRVLARLRGARRVLLVRLRDGSTLDIELVSEQQVEIATNEFQRMLGPIFQT